jgi:cytoskeletal protein RodZ
VSIGDTLAEARRQAGLTITQVSQQTRIRESIVRAIEQGDFSPCGGHFYARGHIRSIAEVVGVDPVPLIREYDEEHPPGSMRASQIFQPATPIRIRDPRNFHLGRVLAVALLAVIGFGAYHVVSTRGTHNSATPTATVRPVATAKPKVTTKPVTHKAAAPKNEAVITLTATSACWVGFDSPTGQSLSQVTIPAGQTERMQAGRVATLNINPSSKTPVTVG